MAKAAIKQTRSQSKPFDAVDDLVRENAKLSRDVIRMEIDLEEHKRNDLTLRNKRAKWPSGKPGKLTGYKNNKELHQGAAGRGDAAVGNGELALVTNVITHEFDPVAAVEETNYKDFKALPMKERISKMKQNFIQKEAIASGDSDSEVGQPKGLEVSSKKISVGVKSQDAKIQKLKKEYKNIKDEEKKTVEDYEKEDIKTVPSVVNISVPESKKASENSTTGSNAPYKPGKRIPHSSNVYKSTHKSHQNEESNSVVLLPPEPLNAQSTTDYMRRKKKRPLQSSPSKRPNFKDDDDSLVVANASKDREHLRPLPIRENPKYAYDPLLDDWISNLNLKDPENAKDILFSHNVSLYKMHILSSKDLVRFGFRQADSDFLKILRGVIELKEDSIKHPEKYKLTTKRLSNANKEDKAKVVSSQNNANRRFSNESLPEKKTSEDHHVSTTTLPRITDHRAQVQQSSIDESSTAFPLVPLERVGSGSLVNNAVETMKLSTDLTSSGNHGNPIENEKELHNSHKSINFEEATLRDFQTQAQPVDQLPEQGEMYPEESGLGQEGDLNGKDTARSRAPFFNDPARLSKVLSSDLAHKDALTALETVTRRWERRQREQEEEEARQERFSKMKRAERDKLARRHARRQHERHLLTQLEEATAPAPPGQSNGREDESPERASIINLNPDEASNFELVGARIKPGLTSRQPQPHHNKGQGPSSTAAQQGSETKATKEDIEMTLSQLEASGRKEELILEGRAVPNSPRELVKPPNQNRLKLSDDSSRSQQFSHRNKTFDRSKEEAAVAEDPSQSVKEELYDALEQLELTPKSSVSRDLVAKDVRDSDVGPSLPSERTALEQERQRLRTLGLKEADSSSDVRAKTPEMIDEQGSFDTTSIPMTPEISGRDGEGMGTTDGEEELLNSPESGVKSGKSSEASTKSTHDLLQQLETKLQALKEKGSSPEAIHMIEKIKRQIAQFEPPAPVARQSVSAGGAATRVRSAASASGKTPMGDGKTPGGLKTSGGKPQNPKSKTLTAFRASVAEQDMVKSLKKQQTQYKQQIRNLEQELRRLKENDPLQSCELNYEDLHFTEQDHVGDGAFADVFYGHYSGSEVAIKRLKNQLSSSDESYFNAEVSLLRELRHPNVVLLLGVCRDAQGRSLMVLEFMANGSLFDVLHDFERSGLDHVAFYQISKDMAVGMNYLHKHKPPVLHLDLKSMNVLLDSYGRAKIGDFGFSKLKSNTDTSEKLSVHSRKGSPAWMAPEILQQGRVSTKSDVYSFGVILWEMLTRDKPYEGMGLYQVLDGVTKGLRPMIPGWVPEELQSLIQLCWHSEPSTRPSFQDIIERLDNLQLPAEWKSLLDAAGVPRIALEDPDVTRSIVEFVHLSINASDSDAGSSVPTSGLSHSLCDQERQLIDLEVVSAFEMLTRKEKEKSYNAVVPILPNLDSSMIEKTLAAEKTLTNDSIKADLKDISRSASTTPVVSKFVAHMEKVDDTRAKTVMGQNVEKESMKYELTESMLRQGRARLRPTTVAPHPSQLADLARVGEDKLNSIAAIIKKALNERRELVEGVTLDREHDHEHDDTNGTWNSTRTEIAS